MNDTRWWEPDTHVVEAVRAGRLGLADLDACERSWVVASLSEAGCPVTDIAAWLGCSTRQVKRIRALVLTQQIRLVVRERHRAEQAERRRQEAVAQAQRLGDELTTLGNRPLIVPTRARPLAGPG